jgi:metallo-beta-lactamase family protein
MNEPNKSTTLTDCVPTFLPHTEAHPLRDGRVELLGAVRQVTGAMTRVDLGGVRVLVDCGVAQGKDAARWRFPDAARDVDAVVLTHGHQDHIGSLPALLEGGFDKPIYLTRGTLAIASISLEDSLSFGTTSPREQERFLKRFRELARPLELDEVARIGGSRDSVSVDLWLREAGHILGSASAELRSRESRVLCSGDLGRPNSPLLRDPETRWPDDAPFDVVVLESTYGNRDHAHGREDIARDLERILQDAMQRRGPILVPSFAIGRTQTLLYFLNELVESGKVANLPVAIDTPMGLAITETYQAFTRLFDREALGRLARGDDPLDFEDLFAVRRGRESARLGEVEGPILIIAGSGMCTGGRIVGHLVRELSDPRATVLFVGHQADGTPGRAIQDAGRRPGTTVSLGGEKIAVRAKIERLAGLSAHADRAELVRWLGHLPGARRVALHHGEVDAQEAFAAYASDFFATQRADGR